MDIDNFKKIDTTAKFSNFKVLNPDFIRCRCNVMYPGRNRNYTDITKNAVLKLIERKGYANVPVVGHIKLNKNGKKIMGSHDRKLEISNDGIQEINECTAMGVVPENCDPSFEKIIDKHGIEREYFSVDVILWSHYFPDLMETAYSDEIYFNHSMEIRMNETEWDDDYIVINDFSLQALCLLGKSTENPEDNSAPCFEDSVVKRFSINESKFKQNFELMLEKLKQYESDGTNNTAATTVQNNATTKPNKEEKKFMNLKKFTEILSAEKIGESNVCKYRLLNVTDSKVFALDMEDYKPYGFDYAVTNEADVEDIVIDFNSKVEMSLSATDKITDENFEEFSIQSEIDSVKNDIFANDVPTKVDECTNLLKAEYEKEIDELGASFKSLNEQYENATKELKKYKAKESLEKANQHKADVDALFERYASKLGKCAEFLVYKAKTKPEDVTLEEVSEKLTLMVGKYTMDNQKNKNFTYTPTETGVTGRRNEAIENKYGHLLDKYIK